MRRRLIPAVLLLLSCGCAGGRIYQNGINHMYLCAVRVVKTQGYQVREEDFGLKSGTLTAGLSTPDPLETPVSRGFFRQAWEVVWNMWERGEFEFWDKDLAYARIRTEERVIISMKAGNGLLRWFGWNAHTKTTVKVKMDESEYGRSDWVIRRNAKPDAVKEGVYAALADCLVKPSKYAIKKYQPKVASTAGSELARAAPEEVVPSPAPQVTAPEKAVTAAPVPEATVQAPAPPVAPGAGVPPTVGAVPSAMPAGPVPAPAVPASAPSEAGEAAAMPTPVAGEARGRSEADRLASEARPAQPGRPPVALVAPGPIATGPVSAVMAPATRPAPVAAADPVKTLADGKKRYEDGAWAEATAALESVLAAEPDNTEALGYLGAVYYQQKRIPESIAAYERYVSLVPSDTRTQEFLDELRKTGEAGK